MRRFPIFATVFLAAVLASGLPPAKGQIVINGGAIVLGDGFSDGQGSKVEPDPAGPHLIEFFDGRQLHGSIESLDLAHHELTWRRKDTETPLVLSTIDISRVCFDLASQQESNPVMMQFGLQPSTPADPQGNHGRATVKFAGGDWLTAEVANILDNKIRLELADHSPLIVDRSQVEWIYFPKGSAPECYEGPTSMAGWVSGGGWTYRDGALRASTPTQIGRNLGSLPDQVEYQFVIDQGNLLSAFTVNLHGRFGAGIRNGSPGMIQCMIRANTLNVYGNGGANFRSHQVDLTKSAGTALDGRIKPGKNNPVLFQVFEDFTGGRLLIYINGHKAGQWEVEKGEPGRNGGGFSFQPTVWNSASEQALSKIRVVPWDGRLPDDAAGEGGAAPDHILLADGTTQDGKFVDLASGTIRLRTEGNTLETPRDQVRMLRFQHHDPSTEAAPTVANLRLAEGGEFDAASVTWQDGKLNVQTRFGTQVNLPIGAVAELRLTQTPPALSVAEDVLVFKNGDRVKGHLQSAAENEKLRWRVGESDKPVEFALAHVLGVRRDGESAHKRVDCVVRFRNDDWLAGQFVTLDKKDLVLDTADAGQVTVPRAQVRALYFSRDGALPISDGASDDREWLKGLDQPTVAGMGRSARAAAAQANLWRCFDGTFSLVPLGSMEGQGASRMGGAHIGRRMDNLPSLVEISFDVTGTRDQILFAAQLFSDPTSPGYFMQFHSQGMYIYDLNPVQRGRGIIPQQMQFEGKLKADVRQRHIDLFANRDTGMLAVFVDGVLITRFGGKPGAKPRPLGHSLMLTPQIGMPCAFSNLWFGPWNGRLPGEPLGTEATPNTAMLNNGDEAQGNVELATPSTLKLASDVGPLDLPLDRITMIDFGGAPPARTAGSRLRLADAGVLTVHGYRVEKDTVSCQSEVAGNLNLPLGSVREIVFSTGAPVKPDGQKQ